MTMMIDFASSLLWVATHRYVVTGAPQQTSFVFAAIGTNS